MTLNIMNLSLRGRPIATHGIKEVLRRFSVTDALVVPNAVPCRRNIRLKKTGLLIPGPVSRTSLQCVVVLVPHRVMC
jgi:hypothetical protein